MKKISVFSYCPVSRRYFTIKRDPEQRRLLWCFAPKTNSVHDDEMRFKHAWKNGVWHCVEPVSFDLADAESIKDKAHKVLGQITSLNAAPDDFRPCILGGQA